MSKYTEKFKDPKWQKKRLEILERDKWSCILCGSNQKTLHVHHSFYKHGKEPWEYENECLLTLCEDCHNYEHYRSKDCLEEAITLLKKNGLLISDICNLLYHSASVDFNREDMLNRVWKDYE